MKEEKKKDDDFEINPIVGYIAIIGAIATVVFGNPNIGGGIIDNILFYTVAPIVLAVIYTFLIYLLLGIIICIICIPYFLVKEIFFKKIKNWRVN